MSDKLLMQRKIPHLLKDVGTGREHRYIRELRVPFDLQKPMIITEKVDGTTVQSRYLFGKLEVWKRFDNFRAGDPKKHAAPESERYRLEKLHHDDPSAKWIWAAVDRHYGGLCKFWGSVWVFFEALGANINARYRNPPLQPTIRVFDIGSYGRFHDFTTTQLAKSAELPIVGAHTQIFGDLETLFRDLRQARYEDSKRDELYPDDNLCGYPLEGWVLRRSDPDGTELVAKIRVKDLAKLI